MVYDEVSHSDIFKDFVVPIADVEIETIVATKLSTEISPKAVPITTRKAEKNKRQSFWRYVFVKFSAINTASIISIEKRTELDSKFGQRRVP